MIRVLGVAFAPFSEHGHSAAQQAFSTLRIDGWRPDNCALDLIVLRCGWWSATNAIERAGDPDALLLFASAERREALEVVQIARNEARTTLLDADGMAWPGPELAPGGPPVATATLAAEALSKAIGFAGAPAVVVQQGPADVVNRVFFGLLTRRRALVGQVRLPMSLESARAEGQAASVNRMQVLAGVKAAFQFAAAAAEARQGAPTHLLKAAEAG